MISISTRTTGKNKIFIHCLVLVTCSAIFGAKLAYSFDAESDNYEITVLPAAPTTSDLVRLDFAKKIDAACNLNLNGVSLDITKRTVDVSVEPNDIIFTGCNSPDNFNILIGYLIQDGGYLFRIYEEVVLQGVPIFDEDNLATSFRVDTLVNPDRAYPETPQDGSIQSGVGVVRGWVCGAQQVQIQFDEEPLIEVAYGDAREDTMEVCGDSNNGYGMVVNWGSMSRGLHRMRTFVDGEEIRAVEFEVAGLDEEFATGLTGIYELENFPVPGKTTTVRWSVADQNFIIIGVD